MNYLCFAIREEFFSASPPRLLLLGASGLLLLLPLLVDGFLLLAGTPAPSSGVCS
jgi:hypothetical protein